MTEEKQNSQETASQPEFAVGDRVERVGQEHWVGTVIKVSTPYGGSFVYRVDYDGADHDRDHTSIALRLVGTGETP